MRLLNSYHILIFTQIERGRTYSHQRNQNVNYILSGLVVIVVAMVVGLGVGHFLGMLYKIHHSIIFLPNNLTLGWSERLELQEY